VKLRPIAFPAVEGYEFIEHIIAARPTPSADWPGAHLLFVNRRRCDSLSRFSTHRPFDPYAERLTSRPGAGIGLLWPKRRLSVTSARIALWLLIYSAFAILGAYTIAAIWGVGIETIALMGELPHGLSRGTAFQETFIKVLAYSSATGLVAFALILWGLRNPPER